MEAIVVACEDLDLEHLWVVYPGKVSYPISENITVQSILEIEAIFDHDPNPA